MNFIKVKKIFPNQICFVVDQKKIVETFFDVFRQKIKKTRLVQ